MGGIVHHPRGTPSLLHSLIILLRRGFVSGARRQHPIALVPQTMTLLWSTYGYESRSNSIVRSSK